MNKEDDILHEMRKLSFELQVRRHAHSVLQLLVLGKELGLSSTDVRDRIQQACEEEIQALTCEES